MRPAISLFILLLAACDPVTHWTLEGTARFATGASVQGVSFRCSDDVATSQLGDGTFTCQHSELGFVARPWGTRKMSVTFSGSVETKTVSADVPDNGAVTLDVELVPRTP